MSDDKPTAKDDLMPMYLLRLERIAGPGFGMALRWCKMYREKHGCTAIDAIRIAIDTLNAGQPLPNV